MRAQASTLEARPIWAKASAWRLALLVVMLIGFGLRVYDLEGQSLWSDEGLSFYRASLTMPDILANTIEIDGVVTRDASPPFYFLLLHVFGLMAGKTVFALRFAGVVAALLSIPLVYGLGAISLDRRVGLAAAFFMAISPFHVWQSQIMRNYGLLITLNLLSVYGLSRFVLAEKDNRPARWLILWLAAGLLGIYTHYFAFLVFAFGLIALALMLARDWGIRKLLRKRWFWIVLATAVLVLLPAAILALDRFAAGPQIDFASIPLSKFLAQVASALAVGVNWSLTHTWWRVLPVVAVAALGLLFSWRRRTDSAMVLLGYQIIPLALLYALSYVNPIYNGVRHLLMALPPFILFVAAGISGPVQRPRAAKKMDRPYKAWRPAGLILALIVVVIQLSWLRNQFSAPELIRDDIRGPAYYLNKVADAQDVIVLHDTISRLTFDAYYDGAAPVVSIPRFGEAEVDAAVERLRQTGLDAERIWFLTEPTPRTGFDRHILSDWAERHWLKIFDKRYPSMWLRVHLAGYSAGQGLSAIPNEATPANATWRQTLTLHGYEVPSEVTAGDPWWLTIYLSQPSSIPRQHTLSLRLVDERGREWAQMDEVIKMGFPPAAGTADTIFRYDHEVIVPPGAPPGRYGLQVRLIDTATGATAPLLDGGIEIHLADVRIKAASCAAAGDIPADMKVKRSIGSEIQLLGYSQPPAMVQAGYQVPLQLWWCARQQPEGDYQLGLQLVNSDGEVAGETSAPLVSEAYPSSQWSQDELLMGRPSLTVPGSAEAGLYDLKLFVLKPGGEEAIPIGWLLGRRSILLGQVQVTALPMETELPLVSNPFTAELFQPVAVEFKGYDLVAGSAPAGELRAGDAVDLKLVWRSVSGHVGIGYKVFVHLLDDSSEIVAQSDSVPANGFRPTTSWRAGEVIVDEHTLSIPEGIGAGEYTLWVGLYDPETGQRPPIFVDGQEQPDGRLQIARLAIRP